MSTSKTIKKTHWNRVTLNFYRENTKQLQYNFFDWCITNQLSVTLLKFLPAQLILTPCNSGEGNLSI